MAEVYLLLGSNLGNRRQNLANARALIIARCGSIRSQSGIYETEAWGNKDQQSFLNQAITVDTSLAPHDLLTELKSIEKEVGRVETTKWGPRIIDIDILFYGSEVVDLPDLKIPHPFLHQRRFTLTPLNDIAAGVIHPILNKPVEQLLMECKDESIVSLA